MTGMALHETRQEKRPRLSLSEMGDFESALANADSTGEVRTLISDHFPFVSEEHFDFLEKEGGIEKLRALYFQVLEFDVRYGTKTSHFISAEALREQARVNPASFASADATAHTVRHRSSQTDSIEDALNICVRSLQNKGLSGKATLFDIGCGSGKILMTAMNERGPFFQHFKRAVGIEHNTNFLAIAEQNLNSPNIKLNPDKITLTFADAAQYGDYNGVNVIFMYNPFDAEIMKPVERNIRRQGGSVILAYIKPMQADLFAADNWKKVQTVESDDPDRRIMVLERGFSL